MPSDGIDLADVVDNTLRRQWKAVFGRPLRELRQNLFAQAQQRRGVGQLAFEPACERRKAGADVADDLGLGKIHLFHRRGRDADVDDRGPLHS